ncbi:MAG: hypothetical protein J5626_02450, partial [Lachnospiraceae bacterium]|nr:hypothetical protein [Lachnospiraceae bacterium]
MNKGPHNKRLRAIVAIIVMIALFMNSNVARAAELGSGQAMAGDFIYRDTDPSVSGDTAGPNQQVLPDPEPSGHEFKSGRTVIEKGTCIKAGKKTVYCKVSGCTEKRETNLGRDKNNHEKWSVVDTDSTCTKQGEFGWRCSACGASSISPKKLADHVYSKHVFTSKGDCKNKTKETWKCANCSATIIVEKDYGNHKWENYHVDRGCFNEGKDGRRCSVCKKMEITKTEPAYKRHDLYYDYKAPTYTTEGYKKEKCYRCSYQKTLEIIPKLKQGDPEPDPSTPEPVQPAPKEEMEVPEEKKATNVEHVTISDPVNVFTGAHEIDFKVISVGGAQNLSIGLSYKSNKSIESIFGKGFSWNYESFV